MDHRSTKTTTPLPPLVNRHMKQSALNSWIEWTHLCKAKKINYGEAAAWNSYFLSRRTFKTWFAHLQLRRERDYNEYLANHTYEQSLLKSICALWRSRAKTIAHSKAQDARVLQVYRRNVKKHTLDKWLIYIESRRIKKQTSAFALDHYNRTLMTNVMDFWRLVNITRSSRREQEYISEEFFARKCRAKFIIHWQKSLCNLKRSKRLTERAYRFRNRVLMVQ
jgi:hypothetical protein